MNERRCFTVCRFAISGLVNPWLRVIRNYAWSMGEKWPLIDGRFKGWWTRAANRFLGITAPGAVLCVKNGAVNRLAVRLIVLSGWLIPDKSERAIGLMCPSSVNMIGLVLMRSLGGSDIWTRWNFFKMSNSVFILCILFKVFDASQKHIFKNINNSGSLCLCCQRKIVWSATGFGIRGSNLLQLPDCSGHSTYVLHALLGIWVLALLCVDLLVVVSDMWLESSSLFCRRSCGVTVRRFCARVRAICRRAPK